MAPAKQLHVGVEMCCQKCVDGVEEILHETHGVASFKIERYDSLVIVTRKPDTSLDKKQLVRRLKRATHNGKASVIKTTTAKEKDTTNSSGNPTQTTTVVYTGMPNMAHGGYLVPWPAASAPAGPSVVTNPFYFQHPMRCHYCSYYSDVVCGNCGRGSNYN